MNRLRGRRYRETAHREQVLLPMPIKVGDAFPTDPVVHIGFAGGPTPCTPQTAGELMSAGKVLFVTLPGAFTPT